METKVDKPSDIKLKALATRYPAEDTLVVHLIKTGLVGLANDPRRRGAVLVEYGTGCRIQDPKGKNILEKGRIDSALQATT